MDDDTKQVDLCTAQLKMAHRWHGFDYFRLLNAKYQCWMWTTSTKLLLMLMHLGISSTYLHISSTYLNISSIYLRALITQRISIYPWIAQNLERKVCQTMGPLHVDDWTMTLSILIVPYCNQVVILSNWLVLHYSQLFDLERLIGITLWSVCELDQLTNDTKRLTTDNEDLRTGETEESWQHILAGCIILHQWFICFVRFHQGITCFGLTSIAL